jgi:hypothetical protein
MLLLWKRAKLDEEMNRILPQPKTWLDRDKMIFDFLMETEVNFSREMASSNQVLNYRTTIVSAKRHFSIAKSEGSPQSYLVTPSFQWLT